MSIVVPSDRDHWSTAKGPCFYCKDDIPRDVVMVMWAGVAAVEYDDGPENQAVDIALHVRCAERLGVHLLGDTREADLAQGESPWDQRAMRLPKAKLERQEWQS